MPDFDLVVRIKPETTDGRKKVEADLKGAEETAKKTGDAIGKAIGGGVSDGAKKAASAIAAFEKDALGAFGAIDRQMKAEQKLWDDLTQKVKASHAAQAEAQAKAEQQKTAALKAYDAAVKQSIVQSVKHDETLRKMFDGWKGILRGVGDAGNAINGVKQAIDLVSKAFTVSKAAAAAAIETWKSMGNSGPSAYVGHDVRKGSRFNQANEMLASVGERYLEVRDLPDEIRKAVENTALDNEDFEEIVKRRIKLIKEESAVLKEARETFEAYERGLASSQFDYEAEARRVAAEKKKAAEAERLARRGKGGGGSDASPIADFFVVGDNFGEHDFLARGRAKLDEWKESAEAAREAHERFLGVVEGADAAGARFGAGLAGTLGSLGGSLGAGLGVGGDGEESLRIVEAQIDRWQNLADVLSGPVSSAFDQLIDGMLRWEMSWKEWGHTAATEIAKVLTKMLLLEAIKAAFGAGWLNSTAGNFLSGLLGGGPMAGTHAGGPTGSTSRQVPGDPFGGGAGGPRPIFTDAVARQAPAGGPGGGGAAPIVNVVMVADLKQAAREFAKSPENTRIITSAVQQNSGAIAAASGRR